MIWIELANTYKMYNNTRGEFGDGERPRMLSFQAIFAEFKRDCIVRSALALFFLVLPLDLLGALQYIVVKAFFASTRDATVAEIQRGVVQYRFRELCFHR